MTEQYSLDQRFVEALYADDPLGAVVRAHIHIEARLAQAIESTFPKPNELPILRFEQRVRLAVALGLDEHLRAPLLELGRIRNAFSHKLDVQLDEQMVHRFFHSFSSDERQIIIRAYERTNELHGLNEEPPYESADVRHRFVTIAVALDGMLSIAVKTLAFRSA
jgi:hypothetical protein